MEFRKYFPSDNLKAYIECYYIFHSDADIEFDDTVFPSGSMEIVFNLGGGTWESSVENNFLKTPQIELWGQITKPLPVKSRGKHTMLGIKFLSHSATFFLNDEIGLFNNHISDLGDVVGNSVRTLHSQLLETAEPLLRIQLVENFLLCRLIVNESKLSGIGKVADILRSIRKDSSESSVSIIASSYGITPRYLHKLIYKHTGLSPKSFNRINRFQRSLRLITQSKSFTSIAYDCGYFDQSHFIRDFKEFTSITPSVYLAQKFPVNQIAFQ